MRLEYINSFKSLPEASRPDIYGHDLPALPNIKKEIKIEGEKHSPRKPDAKLQKLGKKK